MDKQNSFCNTSQSDEQNILYSAPYFSIKQIFAYLSHVLNK